MEQFQRARQESETMSKRPNSATINCDQLSERVARDDERMFAQLAESKLYSIVYKLYDSLMKFCMVQLKSRKTLERPPMMMPDNVHHLMTRAGQGNLFGNSRKRVRNILAVDYGETEQHPSMLDQPRWVESLQRILTNRSVLRLLISFTLYLTLKLIVMGYYYAQHDLMMKSLNPQISENASHIASTVFGETCAQASDISFNSNAPTSEHFHSVRHAMEELGSLMPITTGIGFTSVFVVCSTLTMYCYIPRIVFRFSTHFRNGVRVDFLAFLLYPSEQRRSVFAEIDEIFIGLLDTTNHRISTARSRKIGTSSTNIVQTASRPIIDPECTSSLDEKFYELLTELRETRAVQPYVLSEGWHHSLAKFTLITLLQGLLCSTFLHHLAQLNGINLELIERARLRERQVECKEWHPNGTILVWDSLGMPDLAIQDATFHQAHSESLLELLYLALTVEIKYYFSYQRLLYVLEICLYCAVLGVSETFWASLFVMGSLDKIVWLRQICQQTKSCRVTLEKTRARLVQWRDINDHQELNNILEQLTICYVNFELFRRQSPHFQKISNFVIIQVAVMTGQVYYMTDLVAKNVDPRYETVVVVALMLIGFLLNCCLAMSSYRLNLLEELMNEVAKMLAHASGILSISVSYPIELWRRQMLSEKDCRQKFASRLFLYPVSWESLLTFNVYLLLLSFILLN